MSLYVGNLSLLLGGAALLYLGAEWLVRGGAGLARRIGISPLIIGLTVVAFGTSAPEVIVGIQAGWTGHGELALGNIIGSNIANLGLILGLAALIRPAAVPRSLARREVPVLVLSTLALGLMLWNGRISSGEAVFLLVSALAYSGWMIHSAHRDKETDLHLAVEEAAAESAGAPKGGSLLRLGTLVGVGLILLVLGGHLLVQGASGLAKAMGMSERMIGLTIVAIGTSIPELATSCVAAWRGHTDIAVGNVVGSNIFNVLLCLGLAGLPGQLSTLPASSNADLAAMVLFTLLGILLLRTERTIRRWEGGVMMGGYMAYLVWLGVKG
jgi:cation:H+ antiporter